MLSNEDTRPLRPASMVQSLTAPDYKLTSVAKSLWVNDPGLVTVTLIAESDDQAVSIDIYGPGLIPVRVKTIIAKGTTARDILALYG